MSNKAYDIFKAIAQIWLPAIAVFYSALVGIWNFPYGVEIVGTISALDVFLGAVLQISTNAYNKSLIETTKNK